QAYRWAWTWLTSISGTSSASARILAALTPTNSAPTRPGVLWTATQPIWSSVTPAVRRASSMTGSSRWRWARAATSGTTPPKRACRSVCEAMTFDRTRGSSVNTAAAVSSQEVSMARKNILEPQMTQMTQMNTDQKEFALGFYLYLSVSSVANPTPSTAGFAGSNP